MTGSGKGLTLSDKELTPCVRILTVDIMPETGTASSGLADKLELPVPIFF